MPSLHTDGGSICVRACCAASSFSSTTHVLLTNGKGHAYTAHHLVLRHAHASRNKEALSVKARAEIMPRVAKERIVGTKRMVDVKGVID